MTLDELEEFRTTKKSLSLYEEELVMIQNLLSSPSLPREERGKSSVFVPVSPVERYFRKAEELRDKISQKKMAILVQLTMIEDWLEEVDSSHIRNIIKARYIFGYSWGRVADICYESADRSAPQQALRRFFDKK